MSAESRRILPILPSFEGSWAGMELAVVQGSGRKFPVLITLKALGFSAQALVRPESYGLPPELFLPFSLVAKFPGGRANAVPT